MIKGMVVDLKQVIDQIDKEIKKAKDLIIKIAHNWMREDFAKEVT